MSTSQTTVAGAPRQVRERSQFQDADATNVKTCYRQKPSVIDAMASTKSIRRRSEPVPAWGQLQKLVRRKHTAYENRNNADAESQRKPEQVGCDFPGALTMGTKTCAGIARRHLKVTQSPILSFVKQRQKTGMNEIIAFNVTVIKQIRSALICL